MRWLIAVAASALSLASPAAADFTFTPGTPANGATISYNDWYAAGSYITFSVNADPNYPCGTFNLYFLEINGTRVGQFSNNCTISVYLRTPGRYSWRVILYVYNTATTVTGNTISTVTIGAPVAPPIPAPAPVETTPVPYSPPRVKAEAATARVGRPARLLFQASDESPSKSDVTVWVQQKGRIVWETDRSASLPTFPGTFSATWTPRKPGTFQLCVSATNVDGDQSKTSCAKITVR